jgi:hypothetical protein
VERGQVRMREVENRWQRANERRWTTPDCHQTAVGACG